MSVSDKVTAALTDRENEIKEQGEVVKDEIHVMVKEMICILRQSERQLTREMDTVIDSTLEVLLEKKKSAETTLSQLKDCQEFVEHILKIGHPQEVITSTKRMIECMSHVTEQVNIEDFNPREKADIHFKKDSKILGRLHNIGNIAKKIDLQHA